MAMALVLYMVGFILVPLVAQYGGFAADGREMYALHGGVVCVTMVYILLSSLGSSRPSSVSRDGIVTKNGGDDERHISEEVVSEHRRSSHASLIQESSCLLPRHSHDDDDNTTVSAIQTPWYVRGAIVCATKLWSLISFVWLCLLGYTFFTPVHRGYFVGVGSILLVVWLWGGSISHPFPFSFFGFAMNVREWVQWIGLCVLCGMLLLFGESGKGSIRLFVSLTLVLILFWMVRVCIPRIRRIRGSKFRLFRVLLGVWFVVLVTIVFQAFLFARGHIVHSRQHMQALMGEYMRYQFDSFWDDVRRESPLGAFIARFVVDHTVSTVDQDGVFGQKGTSGSLDIISGNQVLDILSGKKDDTGDIGAQFGLRKHTTPSLQKEKKKTSDANQVSMTNITPTFRVVIKSLLASYPKRNTKYVFANVPANDPDYAFFATARSLGMIGTDIDPNRLVVCQTFFVMKGLVEKWTVSGQGTIFEQYWNEARRRGIIGTCEWGKPVPQSLYSTK